MYQKHLGTWGNLEEERFILPFPAEWKKQIPHFPKPRGISSFPEEEDLMRNWELVSWNIWWDWNHENGHETRPEFWGTRGGKVYSSFPGGMKKANSPFPQTTRNFLILRGIILDEDLGTLNSIDHCARKALGSWGTIKLSKTGFPIFYFNKGTIFTACF